MTTGAIREKAVVKGTLDPLETTSSDPLSMEKEPESSVPPLRADVPPLDCRSAPPLYPRPLVHGALRLICDIFRPDHKPTWCREPAAPKVEAKKAAPKAAPAAAPEPAPTKEPVNDPKYQKILKTLTELSKVVDELFEKKHDPEGVRPGCKLSLSMSALYASVLIDECFI